MTLNQIEIEQPPELEHDAMMAKKWGTGLDQRCRIERSIVWNLMLHLKANGFELRAVYDGEETTKTPDDPLAAMNLCFNLDEVWLSFRKPGFSNHSVYLIFGNGNNGLDLITDWNYSEGDGDGFNAAMDAFDVDRFDPDAGKPQPMTDKRAYDLLLKHQMAHNAVNDEIEQWAIDAVKEASNAS